MTALLEHSHAAKVSGTIVNEFFEAEVRIIRKV
jgi:hypothetical protein